MSVKSSELMDVRLNGNNVVVQEVKSKGRNVAKRIEIDYSGSPVDVEAYDDTIKKFIGDNGFMVTKKFNDSGDLKYQVGRTKDQRQFNVQIAESKT